MIKKNIILALILLFVVIFCGTVSAAPGDTIYVNDSGNDSYDGYSWITAKKTIKNATDTVNENGIVNIANGEYRGAENTNITINKNMTINGQSKDDTIINGTNNNWIFHINSPVSFTITNLTLTNGNNTFGGAINNLIGTVTIINCNLNRNNASFGGAIYNENGVLNIHNSNLTKNHGYDGGAIFQYNSKVNISNSNLSWNTAHMGGVISGKTSDDTLNISNSELSDNFANYGGAIQGMGTINISNSSLNTNTASGSGGAIHFGDGTLNILNSILNGNTALGNGSTIYSSYGEVNMHFNSLYSSSLNLIHTEFNSSLINAQNNFWGHNSNPSCHFSGNGTVNYSPWLYATFTADPDFIINESNSTLTLNFNNAYDGNTITSIDPANGHIPDGNIVIFESSLGSINYWLWPGSINGIVQATLNFGAVDGTDDVSARFDGEMLYLSVDVDNTMPHTWVNIPGGLYNTILTIGFDMDEEGTIYYTLDNTTPSNTSNIYNSPLIIKNSTIIRFFAVDDAGNPSIIHTETYKIDTIPPLAYANLKSGLYNTNKIISLNMTEKGSIFYTLNGTTPTISSIKYKGPISITAPTTIRFLAVDDAGNPSQEYIGVYNIDKTAPKVVLTYPKMLATGISITSTIYIKFSENIKSSVNWSKIVVKNKYGNAVPISKWISGNVLYIKTSNKRSIYSYYTIYIPYSTIKDYAGNNFASGCTFKFKTGR